MRFACGPLDVDVTASEDVVHAKLAEALDMFDQPWPDPRRPVNIAVERTKSTVAEVRGAYLTCSRMAVDRVGGALIAVTDSGVHATGDLGPDGDSWRIGVPQRLIESGRLDDLDELEDVIGLALTTGWRRAGWAPVHAGAVARGPRVAMLCSTTGGGKSTVAAAMLRRGWRALGDDKLLLRLDEDGQPELRSLLSTFNLHPQTTEWMPEVGPFDHLPRYSAWTDKRRVPTTVIAPSPLLREGRPTHLVELRRGTAPGVRTTPLPAADVLSVLLRQSVLPTDAATTKPLLACLAATAGRLEGVRMDVGPDAYRTIDVAAILEQSLA
jgi:hypothetical protein